MNHRSQWFELSSAGWQRLSASRPVGRLLLEAVQNALDEEAKEVRVDIGPEQIVIEDDGERGFTDERLVYTVFLSA
ncbi:MAG: ATP-binding protein, partial [Myxococcota bacterium]